MADVAKRYSMVIPRFQAHTSYSMSGSKMVSNARWVGATDQAGLLPDPSQMFFRSHLAIIAMTFIRASAVLVDELAVSALVGEARSALKYEMELAIIVTFSCR